MKAIILAAGEGKRLRPLTLVQPKPMIEVLGKPLLHHIFDALPKDIDEVILVVGYRREAIEDYFGDRFELRRVRYVVQDQPLGTAHALSLCRKHLSDGERFFFMFGDDLHSPAALAALIEHPLAVLTHRHSDPGRFGVIEVDASGKVIGFEEKPEHPKTNLVSPGVFVLDTRVFDYPMVRGVRGEYFLTDQIAAFMRDAAFTVVESDFWHPIGYPEDVETAEDVLVRRGARPFRALSDMTAILLAGGKGTRMPEGEKHLPKLLVEVAGKPMLAHHLEHLAAEGAGRIRLSLGYRAEEIAAWLHASEWKHVECIIEREPLGTGGGIKLAAKGLDQPFFAANADNLADWNIHSLVRHGSQGRFAVICGVEIADASDFGSMQCDEHRRICAFNEKQPNAGAGIINAGAYVLRPQDFDGTPDSFSIERDLFPKLAAAGNLVLAKHTGNYWFDCGTAERLARVREYFSKSHE